jgi:hypothetical protein
MTTQQQPWLIPPHKNRAPRPKEAGMTDTKHTAALVARARAAIEGTTSGADEKGWHAIVRPNGSIVVLTRDAK